MPKYNKDAKVPLILSCYVCALGAFGAFFRWLQMQVARDAETGMMNPSILNILVPLTIICAAVLFYLRLKKLVDDGKVEVAIENQRQRARDRRGGHDEHVRIFALLT